MKYFLDLFTTKTWNEFLLHGANVSGFSESRSAAVAKLQPGDLLFAYVTQVKKLTGILEVVSPSYVDTTPIWAGGVYPFRVKVVPRLLLAVADAPDIKSLLEKNAGNLVEEYSRRWLGWIRASPTEVPADFGKFLEDALSIFRDSPDQQKPTLGVEAPVTEELVGISHLHSLSAAHILSFGSPGVDVGLLPLNVLVGPNGSGKTNLVECLRLLRAISLGQIATFFGQESPAHWAYKGNLDEDEVATMKVECVGVRETLTYSVAIELQPQRAVITAERIQRTYEGQARSDFRRDRRGIYNGTEQEKRGADRAYLYRFVDDGEDGLPRTASILQWPTAQSNITLLKLPRRLQGISIYRLAAIDLRKIRETLSWPDAADSEVTQACLTESGANLMFVLSRLRRNRVVWRSLLDHLSNFNPRIDDLTTEPERSGHRVFAGEQDLVELLPASRLSDGTLRYLYLLAILLDPELRGMVCIEEPEIGLHPDILHALGSLFREAASRVQLVVTTHSDHLIDSLSSVPTALLVCERLATGTTVTRLKRSELEVWLKDYSLGRLWLRGEFGGTRW